MLTAYLKLFVMEQTQPSHSNSKLSNENSNKKNTDYWKLEQWKLISHMWTKKIGINIQIFAGWSLARFGKPNSINFTLVVRAPFTLDKPWYEVVFLIIQLILCEFKGKKMKIKKTLTWVFYLQKMSLKKFPSGKFLLIKLPLENSYRENFRTENSHLEYSHPCF